LVWGYVVSGGLWSLQELVCAAKTMVEMLRHRLFSGKATECLWNSAIAVLSSTVVEALVAGSARTITPIRTSNGTRILWIVDWIVDYTERPCAPLAVRPRGAPQILCS
jgi:hypothetical protein